MSILERVPCPLCGLEVAGYVPRGGDGTAVYPRRHRDRRLAFRAPCDGRFMLVDLDPPPPRLEPDTRPPLNVSVGFRPGRPSRQPSGLQDSRARLLALLARRLEDRQVEEELGGRGRVSGVSSACPRCCTEPCRRGSGRFCEL